MIDVENACILYCGYFEQWYDDIFNNYRAGDFFDYYYKITKLKGNYRWYLEFYFSF